MLLIPKLCADQKEILRIYESHTVFEINTHRMHPFPPMHAGTITVCLLAAMRGISLSNSGAPLSRAVLLIIAAFVIVCGWVEMLTACVMHP